MSKRTSDKWIEGAVQSQMATAFTGTWDGRGPTPYFESCRSVHPFAGCLTIFSRDTGHHTSGWWKNPDYERCFHLSISYFDPRTREPAPANKKITSAFISGLFGWNRRYLWCEPPYSAEGKARGVWHYRLFCDEGWQPIKPRGEVYGRVLTEAGWLSYSDMQEKLRKESEART